MLRVVRWCALPITPKNTFCKCMKSGKFFAAVFLFQLFNFQFSFSQSACTCDENKLAFTQSYIASHQLIFRGKSMAVAQGTDYASAVFSVTQLFKGSCPKEVTLYFDKKSECSLKIAAGEDWLIYANFKQLQKPFAEYCSRCRKNVINTNKNVEVQYIKSDLTVDVECEKLQQQLGQQQFAKQSESDNRHSNIIPGFWQRIILILLSVAGFAVIYLLLTRWLKNQ